MIDRMSGAGPAKRAPDKPKDMRLSAWVTRLTREVLDFQKLARGVPGCLEHLSDLRKYLSLSRDEHVPLSDVYPTLHDKRSSTFTFGRLTLRIRSSRFGVAGRDKPILPGYGLLRASRLSESSTRLMYSCATLAHE